MTTTNGGHLYTQAPVTWPLRLDPSELAAKRVQQSPEIDQMQVTQWRMTLLFHLDFGGVAMPKNHDQSSLFSLKLPKNWRCPPFSDTGPKSGATWYHPKLVLINGKANGLGYPYFRNSSYDSYDFFTLNMIWAGVIYTWLLHDTTWNQGFLGISYDQKGLPAQPSVAL